MSWIRIAAREVFGLFVDDGRFALAVLTCVGLASLTLPRLPLPGLGSGALLFAGLAVILVSGALLQARR